MSRAGLAVAAAVASTGLTVVSAAPMEIAADAAIEGALARLAAATDASTAQRELDALPGLQRGEAARLAPQLVLYLATHETDPRARAVVGSVLQRLDAPAASLVSALAPLLDSGDAGVQRATRELLAGLEDRSVTRPPDFSGYRAVIEAEVRAGRPPQASLVRFMYESDPSAALLTMVRAVQLREPSEIKPILWGEHTVSELLWKRRYGFVADSHVDQAVVGQLDELSRHGHWWVRLYAAEVIARHPELGSAELLKRLSADTNDAVREAARPRPAAVR